MVVTIIEGMEGIRKCRYIWTGVGRIEWYTIGTADDNPHSSMWIFWCVSVELHLFWTNLYTKIDFWYGKILSRTHRSVEESQIGAYEAI